MPGPIRGRRPNPILAEEEMVLPHVEAAGT